MDVLSFTTSKTLVNQWSPLSHTRTRRGVVSCSNNLYNMLSLSPKCATMDDIKKAYRSMALRYHPDVCHDPSKKDESTRIFVQLNKAYETLSNPTLRQEYDLQLTSHDQRKRWQEQLLELKKTRSHSSSSWGSRMRAQNMTIIINNHN